MTYFRSYENESRVFRRGYGGGQYGVRWGRRTEQVRSILELVVVASDEVCTGLAAVQTFTMLITLGG